MSSFLRIAFPTLHTVAGTKTACKTWQKLKNDEASLEFSLNCSYNHKNITTSSLQLRNVEARFTCPQLTLTFTIRLDMGTQWVKMDCRFTTNDPSFHQNPIATPTVDHLAANYCLRFRTTAEQLRKWTI